MSAADSNKEMSSGGMMMMLLMGLVLLRHPVWSNCDQQTCLSIHETKVGLVTTLDHACSRPPGLKQPWPPPGWSEHLH